MHFQAYLLEGVSRWNADRASDAVSNNPSSESKTYSGLLCQSVNKLSDSVLGREIMPNYTNIGKYTGNKSLLHQWKDYKNTVVHAPLSHRCGFFFQFSALIILDVLIV